MTAASLGAVGLIALVVVGGRAVPAGAQAGSSISVVAVDARRFPTVTVDLALPQAVAASAPAASAFTITGAQVRSAVRLDARQLTVGLVVDDSSSVAPTSLTTEQGSAVELVRNLDAGASVVIASSSGMRVGPTNDKAVIIPSIAKLGARAVSAPSAFSQALVSVGAQIEASPSERGALIVLASDATTLPASAAHTLSATLQQARVPLHVVLLGTRLDPGLAAVATASHGSAVLVGRSAFLGAVDAVTRDLTGQYRVTAVVKEPGSYPLRLTVGGHSYAATIAVPRPATAPTSSTSSSTSTVATTPPTAAPAGAGTPSSVASSSPSTAGGASSAGAGATASTATTDWKRVLALVAVGLGIVIALTTAIASIRRRSRSRRSPASIPPPVPPAWSPIDDDVEADDDVEVDADLEADNDLEVDADLEADNDPEADADLEADNDFFAMEVPTPVDDEPESVTLADWFELWWPTVTNVRPATRSRDERYARTHVLRAFGDVPLDQLDEVALQTWVSGLSDPDGAALAPPAIHRAVQTLDRCLEAAVDEGLISMNPAAQLALPKIEPQPMRFLSDDELWRLVEAIDARYRGFVLLAGFCGLRLAELLALRWERVDLAHHRVEVVETLLEGEGQLRIGRPKSKAAVRVVPLPDFVAHELGRLAESGADPTTLVFSSPEGHLLRPTVFRRGFWSPAVEAAEVGPLGVHDLRTTAVSIWITEGAHPEQVATLAGHTSSSVVLELYGGLFGNQDARLMSALDRRATPHLSAQH